MGDVVDFQRARGTRMLERIEELKAKGHVPAAAIEIAMVVVEFGIPPQPVDRVAAERAFLRMWDQEDQAMNDALRASFEMERDALREVLADAKPENDDGD